MITLIFRFLIYYTRESVEMDEMMWDIKTMTTSDFSIKIYIHDKVWEKWLKHNKTGKLSFKDYLKYQIES